MSNCEMASARGAEPQKPTGRCVNRACFAAELHCSPRDQCSRGVTEAICLAARDSRKWLLLRAAAEVGTPSEDSQRGAVAVVLATRRLACPLVVANRE
jgi:hypothetical protein